MAPQAAGLLIHNPASFTCGKAFSLAWSAGEVSKTIPDPKNPKKKIPYETSKGVKAQDINTALQEMKTHFMKYENSCKEKPSVQELKHQMTVALEKPVEQDVPVKVKKVGFYTRLEEFIQEESAANSWAYATLQVWKTFTHHMKDFNPKVTFEYFTEAGINKFIAYLRGKDLEEKSVQKHFRNLRWFLYWALRKEYTKEDTIRRYRPKFKVLDKPVIYLTKEELMHLYHFQIPANGVKVTLRDMYGEEYEKTVEDAGGLAKTRDLFCFCAFTSLRYSDMAKLMRTDIIGDTMYVTTMKTYDRLPSISTNSRKRF